MKRIISAFILICFVILAGAQSVVSGYVYEDINLNGNKDRNERGIANVAVSNGREVVMTDHEGSYQLPVGADNVIFVIKPAGYNVSITEDMLPHYYYVHKPAGSPKLEYPGVSPTGRLPKSVDFPLYPSTETESFSMLLFGDPQTYNLQEIDYFDRGIVSGLVGIQDIAFGLSMGDLVGDDLSLFKPYIQTVKKIGVPWYNVIGNHDINFDAPSDSLADESFTAHFGPSSYAMNYGKVHFIIMNNIRYPKPEGLSAYYGGLREEQFEFIKNYVYHVPTDHLIVYAAHIPLSDGGTTAFRNTDRESLFNLFRHHPYTFSLSAHTHVQKHEFFGNNEGWLRDNPHHHFNVGTTSGSWYTGRLDENGIPVSNMRDGTPKGYAILHFNGNQYSIEYRAAGMPADHQMTIYAPKVVEYKSRPWPGIFVNFFIGHKNDEVLYRIGDGDWRAMRFADNYDPTYLAEVMEWDFTEELIPGKRPSSPVISTHLWNAAIATDLEPGEHTIEIKAIDMFGNIHSGTRKFKILTANDSE